MSERLTGLADQTTKTCPDCAESVKTEARVCRFCGYRFAPEPADAEVEAATPISTPPVQPPVQQLSVPATGPPQRRGLIGWWHDRSGWQKAAIIGAVVVVGAAIGGAISNSSGGSGCQTLSPEAHDQLASTLPGYAPPGATLGSAFVLKSNEERAPFFANVYFVAGLVNAQPALWAMNRLDGSGMVFSVNEYAYEVSGMGRSSTLSQPIYESDPNAQKVLTCLLKSLPQP